MSVLRNIFLRGGPCDGDTVAVDQFVLDCGRYTAAVLPPTDIFEGIAPGGAPPGVVHAVYILHRVGLASDRWVFDPELSHPSLSKRIMNNYRGSSLYEAIFGHASTDYIPTTSDGAPDTDDCTILNIPITVVVRGEVVATHTSSKIRGVVADLIHNGRDPFQRAGEQRIVYSRKIDNRDLVVIKINSSWIDALQLSTVAKKLGLNYITALNPSTLVIRKFGPDKGPALAKVEDFYGPDGLAWRTSRVRFINNENLTFPQSTLTDAERTMAKLPHVDSMKFSVRRSRADSSKVVYDVTLIDALGINVDTVRGADETEVGMFFRGLCDGALGR